ncbi:MAG: nicotinate phosphoribosyltransferase [Bryobacteraceae bacterium]|jgi:nicotinate phosphoribosyltransferase|nr:nicotinate phosphoribosyltransferase [Bryobacteraceae bacterium]
MSGLLTDLYELTMAAGYFEAGKSEEKATFELSIRRLPPSRNFVLVAGLAQVVEYLQDLRFTDGELDYLRGLPQFARVTPAFFDRLRELRFTGDLFAVPEGTPMFAGEPILNLRAPLIEAQIAETYLLSMITYQSLVATKAARIVETARGRAIVEFGTRRAHSPQAGVLAGRAAYIGGCIGTSNTLAGKLYGVPVYGTAAHSWVLAFETEELAFRRLQSLLGERTVYIVDTYDTLEGTRTAARLGKPLWGIRLDSGNLVELSRAARAILDEAGLREARIMASGDLNEYKIRELVEAEAPIDAFGVGTELATSADAPNLPAVYKLVELETDGVRRFTAKLSEDKFTLPGAKQVFRYADHDEIARSIECPNCPSDEPVEALLRPVMLKGQLVEPLPGLEQVRTRAAAALARLPESCRRLEDPEPFRIEYTPALLELAEEVRRKSDGALV